VTGFEQLSDIAASHHEKLDGSGYFRHLSPRELTLEARILVVADIFDALSARRPYRDAMPLEQVFALIRKDAPRALDATCVEALFASEADLLFESDRSPVVSEQLCGAAL
jgi:HD-GYP domain-containing protein (c-di-GMP phosphodiesterase class II)